MNRKQFFQTKLHETSDRDVEGLGAEREEFDPILGLRKYMWVRNVSGSAMAQGDSVSWEKVLLESGSPFVVVSGTTQTIVDGPGTFTARALAGMFVRIHDDAGGAGAAPEGEIKRIKTNTDTTIYLADDEFFSAAPAAGDTYVIFRPWHVVDSVDTDGRPEWAGIVVAANGIPSGHYGWVQCKGICTFAAVAAGAIANGALLKPGAAVLAVAADSADNGEVVAVALANGVQSDQVGRKHLINILGN